MSTPSFLQLIDRPRVDPKPTPLAVDDWPAELDDCRPEQLSFLSEKGEAVPTLMVTAKKGSAEARPVVIALHGTGGRKEDLRPLLVALARRGLAAVAIDGRHHGARCQKPDAGASEYLEAIVARYRTGRGFPFLYDTVWDVMRLVDYLSSRPDVVASRIGILGISKGGMETYLAAALDPRLAAVVPIIAAQSYEYGLSHDCWQARVETIQAAVDDAARDAGVGALGPSFVRSFWDRVVPGIYRELDGPSVLPLIAPRPLLVINGELDPKTPGLERCQESASKAYEQEHASDRLQFVVQRGVGHELTAEAEAHAIAWLERWLTHA